MRASDTRNAIAEAAAQEFLAHGYAGASLSAIAERLGLTKGALSYHFRAKADFANHFIEVVQAATAQGDAFARAEYPDCGARRLLLYFMVMASWHEKEPQYAAGMALFVDSASPTFEADQVIHDWLALSVDAMESCRGFNSAGGGISALEAAEMLLVTNLGTYFFGRHVRLNAPGTKPLRFVRLSLAAVGVDNVDEYADEIAIRYGAKLPALD